MNTSAEASTTVNSAGAGSRLQLPMAVQSPRCTRLLTQPDGFQELNGKPHGPQATGHRAQGCGVTCMVITHQPRSPHTGNWKADSVSPPQDHTTPERRGCREHLRSVAGCKPHTCRLLIASETQKQEGVCSQSPSRKHHRKGFQDT